MTPCEEDNSTMVTEITLHAELDDYLQFLETSCVRKKPTLQTFWKDNCIVYPSLSMFFFILVSFIPLSSYLALQLKKSLNLSTVDLY